MNIDSFYNTIDNLSCLEDRLWFLEQADIDLSMVAQPDAIIERFIVLVNDQVAAQRVAKVFKKRFGPIALCREATYCNKCPTTLMDIVNDEYDLYSYMLKQYNLLRDAFMSEGFMQSVECNLLLLRNMYCFDPRYAENCDLIYNWYDYEEMKNSAIVREYELSLFLWHPSRVQKWIAAGNDIENYLQ